MDHFYLEEDIKVDLLDQIPLEQESLTYNDPENVFGIDFKENMFSQPSEFNSNPLQYDDCEQDLITEQSSGFLQEPIHTLNITKPLQFPPCRCHKIKCQKKYCQCFRNGRKCSKKCICTDCCNQPVITRLKVNVQQLWQVSFMFRKH